LTGGRGADEGGGGGAAGGGGAEEGGGGAKEGGSGGAWGAGIDGLRDPGGGGGFLPIGGGGPFIEAADIGLSPVFPAVFRRFATEGIKADVVAAVCGSGLVAGSFGAAPGGGLGAASLGGFGAELRDDSGSEAYEDSRFAESKLVNIRTKLIRY
jgi:hypothetical protein